MSPLNRKNLISASHVSPLQICYLDYIWDQFIGWKIPLNSNPVGMDPSSSGVGNGLSTVLIKLDIESTLEPESAERK